MQRSLLLSIRESELARYCTHV